MNLPKLGVGISFQATLADYVFDCPETFDFIEICSRYDVAGCETGRGAALSGKFRCARLAGSHGRA